MPTYVLKCPECEQSQEVFCPIADRTKQVCDICGHILTVVVQPVGAVWHCTCDTASKGRMCD